MWNAVILSVLFVVAHADFDPCQSHTSCTSCIKDTNSSCGWCSRNVIYKDGISGTHCASNDGVHEFNCPGIFSKLQCSPGWFCNATSQECEQDQPGKGLNYTSCLEKCSPTPNPAAPTPPAAPVFFCDLSQKRCIKSTPGNGTSHAVCLNQCRPPPPSAPSTPTPPQDTFSCNKTTYQCYKDTNGVSKFMCQGICAPPPENLYTCNQETKQCVQSPQGSDWYTCELGCKDLYSCDDSLQQCVPDKVKGVPKAICEDFCANNGTGGVIGTWRGIMVGRSKVLGEWDFQINNDSLTVGFTYTTSLKATGSVVFGVSDSNHAMTWTVVSSNIPQFPPGKYKMIFTFDTAQPESRFILVASGRSGQDYPIRFSEAMSNPGEFLWAMATCQFDTNCRFRSIDTGRMLAKRGIFMEQEMSEFEDSGVTDPCQNYGTCQECRKADPRCGWCTGHIVYEGNIQGKQCAGGGYPNIRFKCVGGNYHADDCSDYTCVLPQAVCKQVPLGGGFPKTQCASICKPGPSPPTLPPTPPSAVYLCNQTSHQCFVVPPDTDGAASLPLCLQSCKPPPPSTPTVPQNVFVCNETTKQCHGVPPGTSGATSKFICRRQCSPPKPSAVLIGDFRGIQTDNLYERGEYRLEIYSNNTYSQSFEGEVIDTGRIWEANSHGNLVFVSETLGTIRSAIFSASQGQLFTYLTFVYGKDSHDVPTGWDAPWIFGGEHGREYVYVKLNS